MGTITQKDWMVGDLILEWDKLSLYTILNRLQYCQIQNWRDHTVVLMAYRKCIRYRYYTEYFCIPYTTLGIRYYSFVPMFVMSNKRGWLLYLSVHGIWYGNWHIILSWSADTPYLKRRKLVQPPPYIYVSHYLES